MKISSHWGKSMTSSICGLAHDPTRKLASGNSLDRPGIGKLIALTAHTGHHFLTLSQYKAGVTWARLITSLTTAKVFIQDDGDDDPASDGDDSGDHTHYDSFGALISGGLLIEQPWLVGLNRDRIGQAIDPVTYLYSGGLLCHRYIQWGAFTFICYFSLCTI